MHSGGAGLGESTGAVKQQIIGLIHAVAYLRGIYHVPHLFNVRIQDSLNLGRPMCTARRI